ncbi:2-oxoacid:acceptor oxidoreductase family protein [Chakrabartyella piscis]|uniref:2-oxoacid:acceptor oxidoreductase family protein n=1 Tax=Chakrabartyella piscis TaxID=2918914 RepID=UPI0029588627|nr:2-oxoacid:acceptor oxidoreductase family protein [Chakrabartyella piscis]
MKEIVFAGFGGQGVLTSGLIISDIAVENGENATWMPSYGSAMRGGTANCTVKYGEGIIYNPSQEEPNLLLAMNQPSFDMFIGKVAKDGIVLVSEVVDTTACTRDDVKIVVVPCHKIADEANHSRGANIVMTGAIIKLLGDHTMEQGKAAMERMFNKKGKNKFSELNETVFEAGYNYI